MDNIAPFLGLLGLAMGLTAAAFPLAAFAGTFFFLSFLISLVLAIDSLILYLMTADTAKCGERVNLFTIPIALSIVGSFVPAYWSVISFFAALVTDGALNNACYK